MHGTDVVDAVTAAVGYLRITVGTGDTRAEDGGQAREWLGCEALVTNPSRLLDLARTTAALRGAETDQVAMSLLVQGYAFRIASTAIGAWLVGDTVLDVSPVTTSIAMGRDRPNAVRLAEARGIPTDDTLASLHAALINDHLAPLVRAAHDACRVGEALLWGNVGASSAASFGAFVDPLPLRADDIRTRAELFFASARPEVRQSGRLVPVGRRWVWERNACCLWYKTKVGSRCQDCSLWTAEERRARYDEMLAEGGSTQ